MEFLRSGRMIVHGLAMAMIGVLFCALSAWADDTVILKDGTEHIGRVGMLTSMAENPGSPPPADAGRPIVFVDDSLRRVSFPKQLIREVKNGGVPNFEVINLKQPVCQAGNRIAAIGPILRVDNWDQFGRRIFSMQANTKEGKIDVVQGITAVHPIWTRVEALTRASGPSIVWDTRIATSSIPRDILSKLLANQISRKNANDRLKVVRLYLNAERYTDAQVELAQIIADFPDLANLKEQQLEIRQLGARRALDEIALRQKAGQDRLCWSLLERFPTQDVSGAVLQEVKARQEEYKAKIAQIDETKRKLAEFTGKIADKFVRERVAPCVAEIDAELSLTTIDRMAAFRQSFDSSTQDDAQRVALAISGWLIGGNDASDQLPLALSLYSVRKIARDYMSEPQELKRAQILNSLTSESAGTPRYIAKVLARMKPPVETSPQAKPDQGSYALSVAGLGERTVNYLVQLPPEYDPYRRYPAIVTLNGSGTTPTQQINWWAGEPNDSGLRLGQATRYGYIVIAPDWSNKGQSAYQYNAREHAAVLASVRDACRRFSIDANRVFLSGHSIGGDAAWDIGIAHPDMWAGVIPITASADRYIAHYTANAKYVPIYFVAGELDGDRMAKNARDLDRYMTRAEYNVTMVEYLGRGHEHFYDEILHLFKWMARRERNFFPTKFATTTMRAWDNYFWWVELEDLPPGGVVDPAEWPPPRNFRPMTTSASIVSAKTGQQTINLSTGAGNATIWLAPEMVDFDKPIKIAVKGRTSFGGQPAPDVRVLLEDARTRGDRQHPFWARVDLKGTATVDKPKPNEKPKGASNVRPAKTADR